MEKLSNLGVRILNKHEFERELKSLKEKGLSFSMGKNKLWPIYSSVQNFENWKAVQRRESFDWSCDLEHSLQDYIVGN